MAKFDDMVVGAELPTLTVPVTVALVNGGAMATRDYFPPPRPAGCPRAGPWRTFL